MVTETQFLEQGFQPETQELSGRWTTLMGFLTGNPQNPITEAGFPNGNFNCNF